MDIGKKVMSGLRKLAFGRNNDAVYLVFAEDLPPADIIRGLDLFNVSEMKRVKGGGVEVKFFDRQKALERMFEYVNCSDSVKNAESLFAALSKPINGEGIPFGDEFGGERDED